MTDIFAECSIDYDKNAKEAHLFYAMVQNKFHYAITNHTAAEIVYEKAEKEYEIFNKTQPIESDFDREVKMFMEQAKK